MPGNPLKPMSDRLATLLTSVRSAPPMTAEQILKQRISFVYGQLMDCTPEITKEDVVCIYDEFHGIKHGALR